MITDIFPGLHPSFPLIKEAPNWQKALNNSLNNPIESAKLIDIHNERDIDTTPAIAEIKTMLGEEYEREACFVSETIPTTPNMALNPSEITWKKLDQIDGSVGQTLFYGRAMHRVIWSLRINKLTLP